MSPLRDSLQPIAISYPARSSRRPDHPLRPLSFSVWRVCLPPPRSHLATWVFRAAPLPPPSALRLSMQADAAVAATRE
eukprot:3450164-Pleurochrysis_carterae.AAC.1